MKLVAKSHKKNESFLEQQLAKSSSEKDFQFHYGSRMNRRNQLKSTQKDLTSNMEYQSASRKIPKEKQKTQIHGTNFYFSEGRYVAQTYLCFLTGIVKLFDSFFCEKQAARTSYKRNKFMRGRALKESRQVSLGRDELQNRNENK